MPGNHTAFCCRPDQRLGAPWRLYLLAAHIRAATPGQGHSLNWLWRWWRW